MLIASHKSNIHLFTMSPKRLFCAMSLLFHCTHSHPHLAPSLRFFSILLSSPLIFLCIFLNCHGDFCVLGNKKKTHHWLEQNVRRVWVCLAVCRTVRRDERLSRWNICVSTLKTIIMCRVVDACTGSSRCSGIGELAEEASSWVATGADMTLVLPLCLLVSVGVGCTEQL